MSQPFAETLLEVSARIRAREVTSTEVTQACLDRIARVNGRVNAFITVSADQALAMARDADREIAAGRYRGPLHGVPVSFKDLVDVAGMPTTAASRLLAGRVAPSDAPVAARLRAAGAVFLGKTNLHEFAFGTTSEDSAYGPVRNPADPSRSAGGSSGGAAAAIVEGMGYAAIGTDTGGSIRIPAAACGCVGLKPTFGEIPCDGVIPLSWSLDHVGPLSRSVAGARATYQAALGTPPSPRGRCRRRSARCGLACCGATSRICCTRMSGPRSRRCWPGWKLRERCSWTARSRTRQTSRRSTCTCSCQKRPPTMPRRSSSTRTRTRRP